MQLKAIGLGIALMVLGMGCESKVEAPSNDGKEEPGAKVEAKVAPVDGAKADTAKLAPEIKAIAKGVNVGAVGLHLADRVTVGGGDCTEGKCSYRCPDGDCVWTCAEGSDCVAACSGGGCSFTCKGGQCLNTCSGGGCTQTCDAGECTFSCSGGGCTQAIATGVKAQVTCAGGECQ